jgi:hypothetical protein
LGTYVRQIRCLERPEVRGSVVGEIEMIAEPKRQLDEDDHSATHQRRRQEEALDEALENTFPASDPISILQPAPPADDRARAMI